MKMDTAFPVDHPHHPERAFERGREAYDCGRPDTANPFDPRTEEAQHLAWNDGWEAGLEADFRSDDA